MLKAGVGEVAVAGMLLAVLRPNAAPVEPSLYLVRPNDASV